MSKVDQSTIDFVNKAIQNCPNSKLMNQRLDQIDKSMAENKVQHKLLFTKIEDMNLNIKDIAPQMAKELNEVFRERDKRNAAIIEKMKNENSKKYAGKLSELIVYTLVGMILTAFFGMVIYEIGWGHVR